MADQVSGVEVGTAYVTILPSTKGFHKALADDVGDASRRAGQEGGEKAGGAFATGFGKASALIGGAVGGVFAASKIKQFIGDAISAASDLAESQGKVRVVFGEASRAVEEWSQTSATALLMSQQQALEAAGTYGNLFQAFGLGRQQAMEMSTTLVQLAADLASFNNTSVDEAIEALRSGLSGETEPLKRYGIAINDVRMRQEALTLGIYDGTGVLGSAQKAQAAYSLIMKDTALAQGDVARTADGYANTVRALQAAVDNASASVGEGFVAAITDASDAFGGPGGLVEQIEAAGDAVGDFVVGAEVGLRGVLDLLGQVNALDTAGGGGWAMDWLRLLPGGDWIRDTLTGIELLTKTGDAQKALTDKAEFYREAWAQTAQDVQMQHRAVAGATYAAQQAASDYGHSLGTVADQAAFAATGISTLQQALDEFDARSKSRSAGTSVREQWRALGDMGDSKTVTVSVPNPAWKPGSSVPKYVKQTKTVATPFTPDIAGGRFALTDSGDEARDWATSLGRRVQDKATGFDDPVKAQAYIERWIRRLGGRFDDWGIDNPYKYARSFLPDPGGYAADVANRGTLDTRAAIRQSDQFYFDHTTIYTTPDDDTAARAKQDAHQARSSRVPHGALDPGTPRGRLMPWQR